MTMKKIRLRRPRDASPEFGPLIKSPAPTTNGASPIASNGKSETPSRIRNSNTPARAIAIGDAIRVIEGRSPRPQRSLAGFQGDKTLPNLLIRLQQLAECPCEWRRRRVG